MVRRLRLPAWSAVARPGTVSKAAWRFFVVCGSAFRTIRPRESWCSHRTTSSLFGDGPADPGPRRGGDEDEDPHRDDHNVECHRWPPMLACRQLSCRCTCICMSTLARGSSYGNAVLTVGEHPVNPPGLRGDLLLASAPSGGEGIRG